MRTSLCQQTAARSVSDSSARVVAEAIVTLFMFSLIPVAIKAIESDPMTIGFGRLAIAVAVLTALFRRRLTLRAISKRAWCHMVLLGIVFAMHWYTYFLSIKLSSAATATIAMSSYGLFLLLFTKVGRHQGLRLQDFMLVILAVAGNLFVIPDFSLNNDMTLGLLVGVVSAALFAVLPMLHQRDMGLNNTQRSYGQFLFAFMCFTVAFPATDFSLSARDWLLMAFLGLIGVVAHSMWVRVTTRLSTIATSTIYYLGVPIAMGMSILMLGEIISSQTWFGAAIIICANLAGLVSLQKRQGILRAPKNERNRYDAEQRL